VQPGYAPGKDRVDVFTGKAQPEALLALVETMRQMPGLSEITSASRAAGNGS
jgi:hypothetical protein